MNPVMNFSLFRGQTFQGMDNPFGYLPCAKARSPPSRPLTNSRQSLILKMHEKHISCSSFPAFSHAPNLFFGQSGKNIILPHRFCRKLQGSPPEHKEAERGLYKQFPSEKCKAPRP